MQLPAAGLPTLACASFPAGHGISAGVAIPVRDPSSQMTGQQAVLATAVAVAPVNRCHAQPKEHAPLLTIRNQDGKATGRVPKGRSDAGALPCRKGPTDQDFIDLLNSLEDRISLMSQIEHTRSQIENRGSESADSLSNSDQVSTVASPESTMEPPSCIGECRKCSENQDQIHALSIQLAQLRYELLHERAAVSKYRFESAALLEASGTADVRLVQENRELREQLRQQREQIDQLTHDNVILRSKLPGRDANLHSTPAAATNGSLQKSSRAFANIAVENIANQLPEESKSRAGYIASLSTMMVPSCGSTAEAGFTPPFNRHVTGSNITLSDDGYTAKRARGCRQSVVMGTSGITKHSLGWYYEVVIRETVEGWIGGLGLGVTLASPSEIHRVPDKAWQIPKTYMIGYWGCVWLDGKESTISWQTDALQTGSRVGVLVSSDGSGDLRIFVDGSVVAYVSGALLDCMKPGIELLPIVDIFASTLAVTLQKSSVPPGPPWVESPIVAVG